MTFLCFLSEGRLLPPDELQAELDAACIAKSSEYCVPLEPSDYVLGVADLTGELMRTGVAAAGEGDRERVTMVCDFLKEVELGMDGLRGHWSSIGKDCGQKMRVLRQSVEKVEKSCFDAAVRRAEFGDREIAACGDGRDVKKRRLV